MIKLDNEFVPIMGSDRHCVEYQLNNPKNAKLLKDFIQFAMLNPNEILTTSEERVAKVIEALTYR